MDSPSPPAPEQNDIDVPLLNQSASKEPLEVEEEKTDKQRITELENTVKQLVELVEGLAIATRKALERIR